MVKASYSITLVRVDDGVDIGRNLLIGTRNMTKNNDVFLIQGTIDTSEQFLGCDVLKTSSPWNGYKINLKNIISRLGLSVGDVLTYSIFSRTDVTPIKGVSYSSYSSPGVADLNGSISPTPSKDATNWRRLSRTFTITDEVLEVTNFRIESDYYEQPDYTNTVANVWFSAPKLELGDKATDWCQAIEDIATADDIKETSKVITDLSDKLNDRIGDAESLIEKLNESISMMVVDETGGSLMTQTADGWAFSMAETIKQIQDAAQGLSDLSSDVNNQNGNIEALEKAVEGLTRLSSYIRLNMDGPQPIIELGNTSAFKVRITNTAIEFVDGTTVPAYVTNKSLKIGKAEVEDELIFGGFAWQERNNGNMGLIWKG